MMGQPADQCRCHPLVVKNIHPLGEFQVCIQDDRFLLVYLRQIIKQKLRTVPVIWNIAEFIQNQDLCAV